MKINTQEYKKFLQMEIEELTRRIKPHDTGHIRSAISTLRARIKEIDKKEAGYFDWQDEYLIGL